MVAWFGVSQGATFLACDGLVADEVVFGIIDTEGEGGEEKEGSAIKVQEEAVARAVVVLLQGVKGTAK